MPELVEDLDNCVINFDRKVVVTNLLDEYGGQLEEIAKTVNNFLTAEEAKGKKYLKTFVLLGNQPDSKDEVITVVSENNLKQREQQLRNTRSMLYSAETDGGSKSPPMEFVPLKHISMKLESLEIKPEKHVPGITNGHAQATKEEKLAEKKSGPLGAMFKKQEATAPVASKKIAEKPSVKKENTDKSAGNLSAMFKKQESSVTSKEARKRSPETENNAKQEITKRSQRAENTTKKELAPGSKKEEKNKKAGFSFFLTKKGESKTSVTEPQSPKKMNDFFKEDPKKPKSDLNASVDPFQESSSSEDEEALDALKREVLTDDEEDKPSTSYKRRRIVDSDDEDTGPDVKVERRDEELQEMETKEDQANETGTYLDEDGFIVTVKAKTKKPSAKSSSASAAIKVEKQSPPTPAKKDASSRTTADKKKQGNIMSFFKKK